MTRWWLSGRRRASLIREWTGREPRDVGSFGLRLNLETSDLDLGIGYSVEQRDALLDLLAPHVSFKGERVTRFPGAKRADGTSGTTTRMAFVFTVDGVDVDLSVLTEEDFVVACRMLDDIEANMTSRRGSRTPGSSICCAARAGWASTRSGSW